MPRRLPSVARLALGAAVMSVMLQSVGPILVRKGGFGGLAFAFHRMWVAALIYALIAGALGRPIGLAALRSAALGGTMFAFNVAMFFMAIERTSIANATIIAALQPVVLLFVVNRLFGERPSVGDAGWTVVSIVGVSTVVLGSSAAATGDATGDVLAVAAMLGYAAYFAASKQARRTMGAFEYQAALSIVAALILAPAVLASGQDLGGPGPASWLWVLAVVAMPGTGHLLTNFAHAYVRLTLVSVLTLFIPVGSALMAWAVLGERLVALQGLGMVVVIASLAIMVVRRAPPPGPKAPEPMPIPPCPPNR